MSFSSSLLMNLQMNLNKIAYTSQQSIQRNSMFVTYFVNCSELISIQNWLFIFILKTCNTCMYMFRFRVCFFKEWHILIILSRFGFSIQWSYLRIVWIQTQIKSKKCKKPLTADVQNNGYFIVKLIRNVGYLDIDSN